MNESTLTEGPCCSLCRLDVKILPSFLYEISKGADLWVSCPIYGIGLHYAGILGIEEMVKLLGGAGADVNAERGKYGSALQAAAAKGHSAIALFLLDCCVGANQTGGMCRYALNAAGE